MADFDGDHNLDLAVVSADTGAVSILWGNGHGAFTLGAVSYAVGANPDALVVGDFGNGHPDIAVANADDNNVSILMYQGNRTFVSQSQAPFAAGTQPYAIVAGDFNGDGVLDLATANNLSNNVTVLMGLGGGKFAAPVVYAAGNSPSGLVAADLNGDGRLDLAFTNGGDDNATVLLGRGDGTFVAPDRFSANAIVSTPTLADVTGDGTLDSIALDQAGQILVRPAAPPSRVRSTPRRIINPSGPARSFTVVLSAGRQLIAAVDLQDNAVTLYKLNTDPKVIAVNGIATVVGKLTTGLQPVRVAAGDLNGDGRQDLVVANAGSGDVSVFMATAAGGFTAPTRLAATDHPTELALVDLNGDGRPEIVVSDDVAGAVTVLVNQGAVLLPPRFTIRDDRTSWFRPEFRRLAHAAQPRRAGSMVFGRFSENGTVDLVVVNRGGTSLSYLEGDGCGGFLNPVQIFAGARPAIVRAGRFFPDGHLDLAVLDADNHTITLLRGDGQGHFQIAGSPSPYDAGNVPNGLAVGDFNRDGIVDLIVGNQFGDVMSLIGNGDGTFKPFTRVGQGIGIAVGDLTGNGQTSWLVTDQSNDKLVLQVGGTTPGFTQTRANGVVSPAQAKLADLNGDGKLDMIVANGGGNDVLVYLGLGNGQFNPTPLTFYAGTNPVDVQVADVNGDGRPDVIVTNNGSNDVSILLGDAQALLRPGPRLNVGLAPVSTQVVPSAQAGGLPSLLVTNSGSNNVFMLPSLGGGFFNDATPTIFNTGSTPSAAIVGNFFGGSGLDLVTLNFLSNTLTVYRDMNPNARQDIGSGGVGPLTAVAADFGQNGSLELVVGNNGNGALAIFAGNADGLVETDAIFNENLQHPVALALAEAGEGQELRLLAANEGDENVRVVSRETILEPAKLAQSDLSPGGVSSFSFAVGGFNLFFSTLGALVESGVGDLFVGLAAGADAGGASMNLRSLRDISVDQIANVVSPGSEWLESAVHTIVVSTGLHDVPEGAIEVFDAVFGAARPASPLAGVAAPLQLALARSRPKSQWAAESGCHRSGARYGRRFAAGRIGRRIAARSGGRCAARRR